LSRVVLLCKVEEGSKRGTGEVKILLLAVLYLYT
jgi:hypothetical protein